MGSEGIHHQYPGLEHVSGLIERVTFHSPQTGFAVLQVKVRGHRDLVTVVGTLPRATPGEFLDAHGQWAISPQYGQQFRAETLRTSSPNTAEGIEKFLGSGLIRGIGPRFAARLVEAFGMDVFEVIEQSPERLLDVDGIGEVRKARIGRNPATGEAICIPAKQALKFRIAKAAKDAVLSKK